MASDHIDRVVQLWKTERPDYDLSPVEIIGRAGRIMQHVDRALEAKFEEFGISRASFDVLTARRRTGKPYRLTQTELMRNLFRTSGSMSLRVDSSRPRVCAIKGRVSFSVAARPLSKPHWGRPGMSDSMSKAPGSSPI